MHILDPIKIKITQLQKIVNYGSKFKRLFHKTVRSFKCSHVSSSLSLSLSCISPRYLHKGSGYFAIFLAIPTIILGTTLAGGSRTLSFQITYVIFIILLVLAGIVLIIDGKKKKNQSENEKEKEGFAITVK
jgi:uncharacterized membrane protein YfcA